jgi:hypothetical protein
MFSNEKQLLQRVVDHFANTGKAVDEQVLVTCLPVGKTNCVETIDKDGRSVQLDEYRANGQVIWAGYSMRSGTVYLSPAYAH